MNHFKTGALTLGIALTSVLTMKGQTADEIIQKHMTAVGGYDNWKKINSMKLTASISAGGAEIPVNMTIVQGKGMKVDYTVAGMTGWAIITDKAGWNFTPGMQTKPEALPDEAVQMSQDQLDLQGGLMDYKAKGNTVTYLGKDDVEGTECYKLKVVYKSGKEETMFLDVANYYHIRSKSKVKAGGKEQEVVSTMGDFKKLPEGIVFPMSMDNGNGPMAIKTVEVNKPVADDFFKPTEVAEKK